MPVSVHLARRLWLTWNRWHLNVPWDDFQELVSLGDTEQFAFAAALFCSHLRSKMAVP